MGCTQFLKQNYIYPLVSHYETKKVPISISYDGFLQIKSSLSITLPHVYITCNVSQLIPVTFSSSSSTSDIFKEDKKGPKTTGGTAVSFSVATFI